MGPRLNFALALAGLVLAAPFLVLGIIGIKLTSSGPVFYRARRTGLDGNVFTMFKFRTMSHHAELDHGKMITARYDPRVFPFGRFLRAAKIDELPQLVNVLRGEMNLVGPRPEDPQIVGHYDDPTHFETLSVRPGLVSPGSLYNYTHIEKQLAGSETESLYLDRFLPLKLALDCVYVRRRSVRYDLSMIARTLCVLGLKALGRRAFEEPRELVEASPLVRSVRRPARGHS